MHYYYTSFCWDKTQSVVYCIISSSQWRETSFLFMSYMAYLLESRIAWWIKIGRLFRFLLMINVSHTMILRGLKIYDCIALSQMECRFRTQNWSYIPAVPRWVRRHHGWRGILWSGPSETHDGRPEEGKVQPASQPPERLAVVLSFLLCNHAGQSLVHCHCCSTHSSSGGKDQEWERAQFNLGDSLIIGSPLRLFMLLVHTGGGDGSVAGSMWVQNLHIEKGCVKIVFLGPICLHIKSSVFFSDDRGMCHFFSIEEL